MAVNAGYGALRTGDWEWAIRECLAVEEAAIEETDRINAEVLRSIIDGYRGLDTTERLVAVRRVVDASSDPQSVAVLRDVESHVALAEGRLDAAYDLALETAGLMAWLAPTAYLTAARSALWRRDVEKSSEALVRLEATTHGPAISAARAEIDAGLLALDGPRPAALSRYREALQAWRDLGLPWDEAVTAISMAILLGPRETDVVAAAQTAEATFERLGAKTFLARLRAAMGSAKGEPAASDNGAMTETASRTAMPEASGG
jgi:hypothetical protein